MKVVALSFLVGATVIFLICTWAQSHGPAVGGAAGSGTSRAAAEAGMVGALADWFAVTALFKHPLGIPIPHTAIIKRKKDQLGEGLGAFVRENFMSPEVVETKLRDAQVAGRMGKWLSELRMPSEWPPRRRRCCAWWSRCCATRTSSRCWTG